MYRSRDFNPKLSDKPFTSPEDREREREEAGADLGLNFWGGTDDVGGVISGCGQLSLPDLFLRSQNFEG